MKNKSKYLGNEELYLNKVLNSENWSSTEGSWTGRLEREFATKFECKHGIAFNSGTSTMHSALEALGVGPGDEVISPALSVIMNTSTTIHANAIPVYADILPDTYTIDPRDVERKITSKTKAIMIVSVYGLPCEMDELMAISKKHNIPIIEDNAECFLSRYKGKLVGTFGDFSSYSFENSKHMSCGEGGMIITNNTDLAEKCRKSGGHGFKNLKADEGRVKSNLDVFQNPNYKRHSQIGWNYRLSEFSSAIALAQLERLDELVDMRKQSAEVFLEAINGCDYITPQFTPDYSDNSYWAVGVKYYGDEKIGVSWEEFRKEYMRRGGDGIYGAWSVPYLEPVMSERTFAKRLPDIYSSISYNKGLCPVAEEVQKRLMVFKTNYRDLSLARQKARILKETIEHFNRENLKNQDADSWDNCMWG
jgi:perosamine synthetase|tara:strand:- start:12967 stop:14226 length:1260 start_codon:yes stop_codon:yes gene_type:complete